MNNEFKKLLDDHDYEAIISASEGRLDHDALLARFIALATTGQDTQALALIDEHFDILKSDVKIVFPIHANIIKQTNDKLVGFKILARYKELPYAAIEVEEALHEFESWLHEVKQTQPFDLIKWKLSLETIDRTTLEKAIVAIPKAMIRREVTTFKKLLSEPYPQAIRFLALERLIDARIETVINYTVGDIDIEIIPSMLEAPLTSYQAHEFIASINAYRTGPSEIDLAKQLLSQYAVAIYPLEPPYEDDEHLLEAIFGLVRKYLGQSRATTDELTLAIGEEIEASLARL